MKATGIVRRIDDLGRVVIPKEIRRTMRIREGDPLEIYTDINGEVIFKKYSVVGGISEFAAQYAETLVKCTGVPVLICDRDHCIAAGGVPKKEVLERRITPELEEICESRKIYADTDPSHRVKPLEGCDAVASVISPIVAAGDVEGAVIFLKQDDSFSPDDALLRIAQIASTFFGKQMED